VAFLINPKPKYTSDVILTQEKLKRLFEDNITPAITEFELGANCVYTLGSKSLTLLISSFRINFGIRLEARRLLYLFTLCL
jgi:hypothetical protein